MTPLNEKIGIFENLDDLCTENRCRGDYNDNVNDDLYDCTQFSASCISNDDSTQCSLNPEGNGCIDNNEPDSCSFIPSSLPVCDSPIESTCTQPGCFWSDNKCNPYCFINDNEVQNIYIREE